VGGMALEAGSFQRIGEVVSSAECPGFAVLEGGYGPGLPECARLFLEGYSTYDH
jgi:acetoin utilization deacetylase AcuC-like enzyme